MWYRVRFERASVVFETDKVTVYPDEDVPYFVDLDEKDRIAEEIAYFASILLTGSENTVNPAESASKSIRIAELVTESADNGGEKIMID